MSLPKMRYTPSSERSQVTVFGGINIHEGAGEGEIFAGENLSFDAYPALTGRLPSASAELKGASAIYEWNGKLVIVQHGSVMYDGKVIGLVAPGKSRSRDCDVKDGVSSKDDMGEKQFAVVNTKLIIFPDKVYIDLTNSEFKHMEEEARSSEGENAVTTANSITLGADGVEARASKVYITQDYRTFPPRDVIRYEHYFTVYETLEYKNGAWTGTHSEAEDGNDGKEVSLTATSTGLKVGDLVKLKKNAVSGVYELNSRLYDNYYGDLSKSEDYAEDMPEYYAKITRVKTTGEGERINTSTYRSWVEIYNVEYQVIKSGAEDDRALSEVFAVGDRVYIKGNPAAEPDTLYEITGIDDEKRQLTFKDGSFERIPMASYTLTEDKSAGTTLYWFVSSTQFGGPEYGVGGVMTQYAGFTFEHDTPAGSIAYNCAGANMYVWNSETGETQTYAKKGYQAWEANIGGGSDIPAGAVIITLTEGTGITRTEMTVARKVPDMDFICSHNNRLYGVANRVTKRGGISENEEADFVGGDLAAAPPTGGVSSKDDLGEYYSRVIYVSALGLPTRFYDFEGVDTDSYAVAEASNGDFTGCFEYGDYVLFFEEHMLVKFYGSYPSAMGYTQESIEGVKKGCHKSAVIINDVLYYMGVHGYYAYGGSVPELISYKAFDTAGHGTLDDGIATGSVRTALAMTAWGTAALSEAGDNVNHAIAATDGQEIELYIEGHEQTYIYSSVTGLWLYGERGKVADMCRYGNAVLKLKDGALCYPAYLGEIIPGVAVESEETVSWEAEFPYYTAGTFGRKDLRYIRVRAECAEGAEIEALVKSGEREMKTVYRAEKAGFWTVTVPLAPVREDRITIKLRAKGKAKVISLEKEFFVGSEVWETAVGMSGDSAAQ